MRLAEVFDVMAPVRRNLLKMVVRDGRSRFPTWQANEIGWKGQQAEGTMESMRRKVGP